MSYIVGSDYFATLGLRDLSGRDFTPTGRETHRRSRSSTSALARELFGRKPDRTGSWAGDVPPAERHRAEDDSRDAVDGGRRRGAWPQARPVRQGTVAHSVPFGRQFRSGMNVHLHRGPGLRQKPRAAAPGQIRAVDERLPVLGLKNGQLGRAKSSTWSSRPAPGCSPFGAVAVFLAVSDSTGRPTSCAPDEGIGIRMALGSMLNALWMVLGRAGHGGGPAWDLIAAGTSWWAHSTSERVRPGQALAAPGCWRGVARAAMPALRATRIQPTVASDGIAPA
jgi:hypothetical protein